MTGVCTATLTDCNDRHRVLDGSRLIERDPMVVLQWARNPRRRYDENLGTRVDQGAGELREPQVVTRHQANRMAAGLHGGGRDGPRREAIGLAAGPIAAATVQVSGHT